MNIPLITLPILWTVASLMVFAFWPNKRGDYIGGDIASIIVLMLSVISALIGWIVYLALK